jgi:CXXC-20-CXXC protein
MLECPHCGNPVELRELKHQGMLASYRVCPHCGEKFEVDRHTKRRQAVFIVLAMVSLIFTVLMYFNVHEWAAFAISTYVVLGALIYFANKKVYLVKYYRDESNSEKF